MMRNWFQELKRLLSGVYIEIRIRSMLQVSECLVVLLVDLKGIVLLYRMVVFSVPLCNRASVWLLTENE